MVLLVRVGGDPTKNFSSVEQLFGGFELIFAFIGMYTVENHFPVAELEQQVTCFQKLSQNIFILPGPNIIVIANLCWCQNKFFISGAIVVGALNDFCLLLLYS